MCNINYNNGNRKLHIIMCNIINIKYINHNKNVLINCTIAYKTISMN